MRIVISIIQEDNKKACRISMSSENGETLRLTNGDRYVYFEDSIKFCVGKVGGIVEMLTGARLVELEISNRKYLGRVDVPDEIAKRFKSGGK